MAELRSQTGRRYRFRMTTDFNGGTIATGDLVFYAQNGMIVMEDEGNGDFFVVTRREFLERAQALNRMNSRERHADQRDKINRTVEEMICCVKDAKFQGDPLDPRVQEWYLKHRPWKNQQLLIPSMPGQPANPSRSLIL